MMSISPMPGHVAQQPRYGVPCSQNAGQYPAAAAPVTFGIWIRACTHSFPPAGGWKSCRLVSIRPELHPPLFLGVICRLPCPSRETFCVELVIVSTSPVPKFAGPPGYDVPVVYRQLPLTPL